MVSVQRPAPVPICQDNHRHLPRRGCHRPDPACCKTVPDGLSHPCHPHICTETRDFKHAQRIDRTKHPAGPCQRHNPRKNGQSDGRRTGVRHCHKGWPCRLYHRNRTGGQGPGGYHSHCSGKSGARAGRCAVRHRDDDRASGRPPNTGRGRWQCRAPDLAASQTSGGGCVRQGRGWQINHSHQSGAGRCGHRPVCRYSGCRYLRPVLAPLDWAKQETADQRQQNHPD